MSSPKSNHPPASTRPPNSGDGRNPSPSAPTRPPAPTPANAPPLSEAAAEKKLASLEREVAKDVRRRRRHEARTARAAARAARGSSWQAWAVKVAVALAGAALPFVVLVGGGVWLYRVRAMPTWVALAGAGLLAAGVLAVYGAGLSKRLTGRARLRWVARHVALPAVACYVVYGLLFLSSVNAKTPDVQRYYRAVHPLLRLGLSTAILLDGDIVVTDTQRRPADYDRMGLPRLDNSLHFVQGDGYVHAVDLRTQGRSWWRNAVMTWYFRLMGFRTLRHVGTADHLHVSVAPPGDMRR